MYYKIKKIPMERLEENRAVTAQNLAVLMEKEALPWQHAFDPQKDNDKKYQLPYDVISKKYIKGYNFVELTVNRPDDKLFITFNDVQKENYRVKKGAKSTPLEDIRNYDITYPVDPKTKRWTFTVKPSEKFIAYNKAVFSVNDLNGKHEFKLANIDIDGIEFTKKLLSKIDVKIITEKGLVSAYYAPRRDEIHIGEKEVYKDEREYYADLLKQGMRSLMKPGRVFPNGSKGFAKDVNNVEFVKDRFRLDLATYQLSCLLKLPYKPIMNKLNNKQLLFNFGFYPYYLTSVARDSEKLLNAAINIYLDKQQEKIQTENKTNKNKLSKNDFVDKLKQAIQAPKTENKQQNEKQTLKYTKQLKNKLQSEEQSSDLKTYIISVLKEGKLSDRMIVDSALKQSFKEFEGKTVFQKKQIVNSIKKEAYSQIKTLDR